MNISSNLINKEIRKSHYEELVKYMPFKDKVLWAKTKIKEFFQSCEEFNKTNPRIPISEITISFSGGKDSTVLFHLVNEVHKEIKSKFYLVPAYAAEITFPSTIKFIKETVDNFRKDNSKIKELLMVPPKMPWNEILNQKGYPIFSKQISLQLNRIRNAKTKTNLVKWAFGIFSDNKGTAKYKLSKNRLFLLDNHMIIQWPKINNELKQYFTKYDNYYFYSEKCCDFVKGGLKHDKRPSFIGTMANESEMRKKSWIENGCNITNKRIMKSRPLSIWTEKDVWNYIKEFNLEVNPAYGYNKNEDEQNLRFTRLGCTSCPFGSHIENKINERLSKSNKDLIFQNRFEKLKEFYPTLYTSQVISTGMYKILIDMGIEIKNDEYYQELFKKRQEQINKWYVNFEDNLLRLFAQIENHNNYKNKSNEGWFWTIKEIKESFDYFDLDKNNVNKTRLDKIRIEEQNFYKQILLKNK